MRKGPKGNDRTAPNLRREWTGGGRKWSFLVWSSRFCSPPVVDRSFPQYFVLVLTQLLCVPVFVIPASGATFVFVDNIFVFWFLINFCFFITQSTNLKKYTIFLLINSETFPSQKIIQPTSEHLSTQTDNDRELWKFCVNECYMIRWCCCEIFLKLKNYVPSISCLRVGFLW